MNIFFIFTIIVVGLSGIVAQILLLRELLVSFSGNELTIGIVLANWVIAEALGVFLIGRFIDKIRNKFNVFIILQLVFSLALPLTIYLSRTFKILLGFPFGETIGLNLIYICSFFIILPVSFCHGALFSVCALVYSLNTKESASAIGKVYTWEMSGTILGGIILTYLFIPYLNSFQAVFLISFINLAISIVHFMVQESIKHFPVPLRKSLKVIAEGQKAMVWPPIAKAKGDFLENMQGKNLKYITIASLGLVVFLIAGGGVNYLQRSSITRQWKKMELLDYRNSIYGNITVTKQPQQYTFYYNGMPVITTPFPDITFVEEFGNLPLLFHRAPKDVLVISAGAGGLINEMLKHPIKRIDYAEIDPLIINMLKIHPTSLSKEELADKRVNIFNVDGRYFLRTHLERYDVILIGLSNQSDLSTNRIFTEEFFTLVKNRLNPDGVFAFWLPGSLTYLSAELRDLNSCILNGLKSTFRYVRIIPGDYNIYLASPQEEITTVSPGLLLQRMDKEAIKANVLIPGYIEYRLDNKWLDWFNRSLSGGTKKVNRDYQPVAVYQMLLFWNKKFSPTFFYLLDICKNLDLKVVSVFILLLILAIFYAIHRTRNKRIAVAFSIAATGFFGMLTTLILTFSFQIFYGYLYHRIGILVSIFMAGVALGSILITSNLEKIKNKIRFFQVLEILIIAFSSIMALIITRYLGIPGNASLVFIGLFFISGMLMGLQFPLASKIYLEGKKGVGETSGVLYSSDLIGGWVAGVLGGVILLPVLGLFNACMVMVILKAGSLFIFSLNYEAPRLNSRGF